jgi:FixJ family two-component response regulator
VRAAAAYREDENRQRFGLTLRETELARMIADGMTNAEIAKRLSLNTILRSPRGHFRGARSTRGRGAARSPPASGRWR